MYVIKRSELATSLPKKTKSLCPQCGRIISAEIYEKDGKIMYRKECPEHGVFDDVYFGDAEVFYRLTKWVVDGIGVHNPQTAVEKGCPYDCGLCPVHYSHTALANVDLTNRCNMNCPICFANANATGYVYEPSFEQVVNMLRILREEKPVPCPAVQFAGGEPTIYPRFFDVIRAARDLGFAQIQVATNGIRLAEEPDFCQKMADAGLHTVYLQFDGFKEETYLRARGIKDFLKVKLKAIENCRNVKPKPLATVLVPTMVKGINDDEAGKMVDFALENLDVIRSVNYQPVAFTGRISKRELMEGRYTIGDLIDDLVNQTTYFEKEDFYSIPVAAIFAELASQICREPKVAFTPHPACGAATYLFKDYERNKVIPITRFINVDGVLEDLMPLINEGYFEKHGKIRNILKLKKVLERNFDREEAPTGFKLRHILAVFDEATKEALGELHWNTLFIGTMHFQDPYNYDIERVMRCVIHYATPDGRIIPFCAYNSGPTFREEVEKKFSVPLDEWKKMHGGDV